MIRCIADFKLCALDGQQIKWVSVHHYQSVRRVHRYEHFLSLREKCVYKHEHLLAGSFAHPKLRNFNVCANSYIRNRDV